MCRLSLLPWLLFLVLQKEAMTGDLGVMCYICSKMDLCTRRICWKFTVFICYVSLTVCIVGGVNGQLHSKFLQCINSVPGVLRTNFGQIQ